MANGLGLRVDPNTYERPAIFQAIQRAGEISDQEMASTFNMGLGFLVVVSPEVADQALETLGSPWLRVGSIHDDFIGVDLGYARSK